jgi:hypothetical protein
MVINPGLPITDALCKESILLYQQFGPPRFFPHGEATYYAVYIVRRPGVSSAVQNVTPGLDQNDLKNDIRPHTVMNKPYRQLKQQCDMISACILL